MNPTKEFRDYLISQGAALVGIGDLTAVPSSDYPVGIAVAIPLPKHVIKGLQLAPTREYYELYNSLSDKLNTIVTAGAKYLTMQWQGLIRLLSLVLKFPIVICFNDGNFFRIGAFYGVFGREWNR